MVGLKISEDGVKAWIDLNENYAYCLDFSEKGCDFYFGKLYSSYIKNCKNKAEYYKIMKLKAFL